MAPKPVARKKKKTKEELEEDKRVADEVERLAEEGEYDLQWVCWHGSVEEDTDQSWEHKAPAGSITGEILMQTCALSHQ